MAPVPPLTVTVWLYTMLSVSAGNVAGLTLMAGLIVTEYARDPVPPTLSVAVTVKGKVLAEEGVPLMTPVVLLRLKPLGNEPPDTLNVLVPVPPLTVTVWE